MIDPNDVLDDARFMLERLPSSDLTTAARLDAESMHHRFAAVAVLLAEGDDEAFRAELAASGRAILQLRRLPANAVPADLQRLLGAGHWAGLVDALVSSDDPLAREIAPLYDVEARARVEYEDDALHGRLLASLIQTDPRKLAPPAFAPLRARLAAVEGDRPSIRTALLSALADVDPSAWSAALDAALDHRAEQRRAHDKAVLRHPARTAMEDAVYLEGLALLRLADGLGFPPLPDAGGVAGLPALALRGAKPWSWT